MPSDSFDLNFNFGGSGNAPSDNTSLIHSIDKLTSKLSGLENALGKFIQNTTANQNAQRVDPIIAKARLTAAESSKLRATFLQTEQGTQARTASTQASLINAKTRSLKEEQNMKYRGLAEEAYKQGDYRLGDRYGRLIQTSTARGIEDGMMKFIKGTAIVGGANFISNALSRNVTLSGQIAQAAMTNPLLNYDYGSQYSAIANLSAQQHYANLQAGITATGAAVGGIAGSFVGAPFAGAGIGAGLASALGGFVGAKGTAEAQMRSQALGTLTNQNFATQALEGTNVAAFNALRKRRDYVPYTAYGELDPTKPFAMAIAKGAAVYDKNFNAINKLTDYALAAQIPLGKIPQFAASMSQLNLSGAQFQKFANQASAYGVDPAELAQRSLMFVQGGMDRNTAINVAAKSFQNVSGFQAYQQSYFQGTDLDRTIKNTIASSILGFNLDNAMANPESADGRKLARLQKEAASSHTLEGGNIVTQAVLASLGITQAARNVNAPQIRGGVTARITPTHEQTILSNQIRDINVAAAGGDKIDVDNILQSMSSLVDASSNATNYITALGAAAEAAAQKLYGIGKQQENTPATPTKNPSYPELFVVHHYKNSSSLGGGK